MTPTLRLGKTYRFRAPGNMSAEFRAGLKEIIDDTISGVIESKGIVISKLKKGLVVLLVTECQDPETKLWTRMRKGFKVSVILDDIDFI